MQNNGRAQAARRRPKRRGSRLITVLILLMLGCMCFAGWQVISILLDYRKDREAYDELATRVLLEPAAASGDPAATEQPWPTVDWSALLQQNSDVVGWLYSPDTPINYPVVQAADNDLYLHRNLDGQYSSAGTLFADCGSMLGPTLYNYIIYGHHMRDGSMFASLDEYADPDYYAEHPCLYFLTPEAVYRVDVIASSVVESVAENYPLWFTDETAYRDFLDHILSRSSFYTDAEVSTGHQLMTLSTCDYSHNYEDPRRVVWGLMVPMN